MTEDEFAFGVFSTGYYEAISPPKSVFEELNGTGKIKNIRSNEVRKLIGDYYAYLEYLNTQLVYFRNQFTKPVDEAGEDMIYVYDEHNHAKIRALVNFKNLYENNMFISKHTKALRDQIVFNEDRKILLNHAIAMCKELANALNINCIAIN